jgi:hypothetical protein
MVSHTYFLSANMHNYGVSTFSKEHPSLRSPDANKLASFMAALAV